MTNGSSRGSSGCDSSGKNNLTYKDFSNVYYNVVQGTPDQALRFSTDGIICTRQVPTSSNAQPLVCQIKIEMKCRSMVFGGSLEENNFLEWKFMSSLLLNAYLLICQIIQLKILCFFSIHIHSIPFCCHFSCLEKYFENDP